MKLSAPITLNAKIFEIRDGTVNSNSKLALASAVRIASMFTKRSRKSLGLKVDSTTNAIIMASGVMPAID